MTGREIYFHPSEYSNNKIGMVTNADENGSEEGWNSITCDYFLPYTINESWMIGWDNTLKARGCAAGTGEHKSSGIVSSHTVNKSTEQLLCAETTTVTEDDIQIVQSIFFKPDEKNFRTHVEITNNGDKDLSNVRFMRSFDPDQGQIGANHTPKTLNVIGHEDLDSQGTSVIAYKTDGTAPFIFFTADERAVAGWATNLTTSIYSIESGIKAGTVSITPGARKEVDGNIFIYYDFPTLNSHETVEISYYSSLDTNIGSAIQGMLSLDISSEEIEKKILNDSKENVSAFVSASITGVDLSACTVSYQWYISKSSDVTDSGEKIEGADTGRYKFVPTGNKEDAGVYYLCCEVTAVSGEQTVTKYSKNLIITVYNQFDLQYDSNGGTGSIPGEENISEGESRSVADGISLTPPEGMHFKAWNTKADGSGVSYQPQDTLTMTDNVVLYAQWENDFTDIRFKAYLDEQELKDNSVCRFYLTASEESQEESELTYQGDCWTIEVLPEQSYQIQIKNAETGESIGETAEFKPGTSPYETEAHLYTIHWDTDGDAVEDEKTILMKGAMPVHEDGYREETDGYYYDFKGWDKELAEVTGEETYTALFEEHTKKYMIEWDIDGDEKADSAWQMEYGALPEHPDPEKVADYQYAYHFAGWTPEIEKVTGNQMYSAIFHKTLNQYTITWPEYMVGCEIVPESGSKSPVAYNGSYSFQVKTQPGYDISTLIVTANGKELKAENGIYTVSSIGTDGRDVKLQTGILDSIPPTGKISINNDSWTAFQEKITFDKFYTTTQSVSIEAEDSGSGVQSVLYCISEKAVNKSKMDTLDWIPYVTAFSIAPNRRGIIYAKIVDIEGNVTYLSTCGLVLEAPYDKNDIWKYEPVTVLEEYIYRENTDKDIKGSIYNKVRARVISNKKTQQTLKWNKVIDASGYIIYGNKCGLKYKMKKLKTIKNPNTTKWVNKKLKKNTYYKYIVVAYKIIDGKKKVLSTSKSVHAVTAGGKYQNPTKVKVKQKSVKVKVGKKKKITATKVMPKGGKMKEHVDRFRYESSDKKIATVDKKGRIVGKNPGTCYVFVYIQNGIYQMVKVTIQK